MRRSEVIAAWICATLARYAWSCRTGFPPAGCVPPTGYVACFGSPRSFAPDNMEPILATDPALTDVLDALVRREPIFHRPEFGTTRDALERMTDAAFWEVGASGRRYSRKYVIDTVLARHANPTPDLWQAEGFHCLEIAPDNFLLTYTLRQGERTTRRATIWRRDGDAWRIVFHQGTVVAPPDAQSQGDRPSRPVETHPGDANTPPPQAVL